MEIDLDSTVTVDSLLKSYPSLQRLPNKDRVREITTPTIDEILFLLS
jgi:hypothetical protein